MCPNFCPIFGFVTAPLCNFPDEDLRTGEGDSGFECSVFDHFCLWLGIGQAHNLDLITPPAGHLGSAPALTHTVLNHLNQTALR